MTRLEAQIREAVRYFWLKRAEQAKKQTTSNEKKDAGDRSAVTGGKQMSGFVDLLCNLLQQAGVPDACVYRNRTVQLPGWFRAEKQWDLIVKVNEELAAVLELKSQVGPSFGNNFNNRTEEALGSATDIVAAFREGAFRPSPRPCIGYLMLLEDCEASRRPVSVEEPHFKVFPEFRGASYTKRYEILLKKLVRDQLYDAAAFIVSAKEAISDGAFVEPNAELSFANMVATLVGRAVAAKAKYLSTKEAK
jgi:hypothetical protein